MLILREISDAASVADTDLRALIVHRFETICEGEPYDADALGAFLVLQPGDGLEVLAKHLGFSVLTNRYDGTSFGDADFHPSFELIEEHACCFEMVFVLSDDGYGALVWVPKSIELPTELLEMCRRYAVPSRETSP